MKLREGSLTALLDTGHSSHWSGHLTSCQLSVASVYSVQGSLGSVDCFIDLIYRTIYILEPPFHAATLGIALLLWDNRF